MIIMTYNPDGSIKEVRELHFQIPTYITSFDPNKSFLNINDDEMAVFDYDDKDEQEYVFEKFKLLLYHDFCNYVKNILDGDTKSDLIKLLLRTHMDSEELLKYGKDIRRFIRNTYSKPSETCHKELIEDKCSSINISIIVEVLMYNMDNAIAKDNNYVNCYKSFFSQIHWIYYALYRRQQQGSLTSEGYDAMNILRPFANLNYKNRNLLITHEWIKIILDTLYSTQEKFREELYRLFLVTIHYDELGSGYIMQFIKIGNALKTIIEKIPASVIENVNVQLNDEEIIALSVNCQAGKEIEQQVREIYTAQYKEYLGSQGESLEQEIKQSALEFYRHIDIERLLRDNWKEMYYKKLDDLRNKIENKPENQKMSPYRFDVPDFYYFLLVNKCIIGKKYEFEGNLLNDLIIRAIICGSEVKSPLYKEMYQLNWMAMAANLICDERNLHIGNQEKNSVIDDDQEKLLSLLGGLNDDIVEKLRNGEFHLSTSSQAVDYIIVWLEPLFKRHLNRHTEENEFRAKIINLLNSNTFNKSLLDTHKKKTIKHNLNFKLVLNIIGMLSELGKDNFNNWVNRHVGPSLIVDLTTLWKLKGSSSFHKYVSGWKSNDYGISVLTKEMKDQIEKNFQ